MASSSAVSSNSMTPLKNATEQTIERLQLISTLSKELYQLMKSLVAKTELALSRPNHAPTDQVKAANTGLLALLSTTRRYLSLIVEAATRTQHIDDQVVEEAKEFVSVVSKYAQDWFETLGSEYPMVLSSDSGDTVFDPHGKLFAAVTESCETKLQAARPLLDASKFSAFHSLMALPVAHGKTTSSASSKALDPPVTTSSKSSSSDGARLANASTSESTPAPIKPVSKANAQIHDEAKIWQAVQKALVGQESARKKLFNVSGDNAQLVLDTLQKITDSPSVLPALTIIKPTTHIAAVHRHLRRLLLQLSLQYRKLPQKLFLRNVSCDSDSWNAGGFADIHRGTYQGQGVVLKKLRIFRGMSAHKQKEVADAFHHECLIWRTLYHEHILPILGVDNQTFAGELCMVLPLMQHGNVRDVLSKQCQALRKGEPEISLEREVEQVHTWIKEVARGLVYLHEEGVAHGDLRGHNILVDSSMHARISDFGLAVFADGASRTFGSVRGGNIRWLAPEIMDPSHFKSESSRPTCAADIYSFACLCVELYTNAEPFSSYSQFAVLGFVLDGERPEKPDFYAGGDMGDGFWSIIKRCWNQAPADRLTAPQVLELLHQTDLSPILPKPGWTRVATIRGRRTPMFFEKRKASKIATADELFFDDSGEVETKVEPEHCDKQVRLLAAVSVALRDVALRYKGLLVAILVFCISYAFRR